VRYVIVTLAALALAATGWLGAADCPLVPQAAASIRAAMIAPIFRICSLLIVGLCTRLSRPGDCTDEHDVIMLRQIQPTQL
jgi:hypothetical protein